MSHKLEQFNNNSNWTKLLGFRNMQEKLENITPVPPFLRIGTPRAPFHVTVDTHDFRFLTQALFAALLVGTLQAGQP